MKQYNKPRTS